MSFNKVQLNKLLIHTLKEMGYNQSAITLQKECGGIQIESTIVQKLFQYIHTGTYEFITLKLLCNLPLKNVDNSLLMEYFLKLEYNQNNNKSSLNTNNSMKISNLLEQKEEVVIGRYNENGNQSDLPKVMNSFAIQFDIFYHFYQLIKKNNQLCVQFKKIIQIMVIIIRQFFVELVSYDVTSAVQFLRNTFRKFIELWDSVLNNILDWNIGIDTSVHALKLDKIGMIPSSPDSLLRELSFLLTTPPHNFSDTSINNNSNNDSNNDSNSLNGLVEGFTIKKYTKEELINDISQYINPDDLVPSGRLITLLKQAIQYQKQKNILSVLEDEVDDFEKRTDEDFEVRDNINNAKLEDSVNFKEDIDIDMELDNVILGGESNSTNLENFIPNKNVNNYNVEYKHSHISLLQDNVSSYRNFKLVDFMTLMQNDDEIWYLQFSPDGKYLASATADSLTDKKVLVYDVNNNFEVYKVLSGNTQSILYLAFSPDSKYLIACPFNENANIYDVHEKGEPTLINSENSDLIAEIISPMDSFEISKAAKFRKHQRSHHTLHNLATPIISTTTATTTTTATSNTNSSESVNSTESSASLDSSSNNGSLSLNSHSRNLIGNDRTTSPRIWCCDWFHTTRHNGKFIVGSPDREVVIYDMDTKSVIFSLSEFITNESLNKTHNDKINPFGSGNTTLENSVGNINGLNDKSMETMINDSCKNNIFPRIHDLKITYDDKCLILMTHNGIIEVYDISSLPDNTSLIRTNYNIMDDFYPRKISRLNIEKNLTSISLPQPNFINGKIDSSIIDTVVVNLQLNEIQLWNFKENILLQKFFGQKQEQFIIRSCFGYNNKIISSGSEDGKVYLWDRSRGNILGVLPGHSKDRAINVKNNKNFGKNCNVVAWNPKNKNIFASGGDDGYIKIWKIVKE